MASSSSSHLAPSSSSQWYKYDVFLGFRGGDIRKTFVDHFYSALVDRHIRTFKDDEDLRQGDSIGPSLFNAIKESKIAVVIFSKNYADSSWCLEELAYIMKLRDENGLIVKPIFYDVEPSEVGNQKRKFGETFDKQEAENPTKVELWRKALVDASNIAGWELKNIANGHESKAIKEMVDTIRVRMLESVDEDLVDEDLVGMRPRMKDLESLLDIGSNGVRMVGIWGIGGSGKTTLATSLCMEISRHFQGYCIVENVREKSSKYGFKKLQKNILSVLLGNEVEVESVVEGMSMMKSMLCRRKVLVLLDDVDKLGQLESLVGKHNWFGSGSRIIITTRDEHLLRTHKVDEVCRVRLLSHEEAIRLFNRHAFNEKDPVEDYETLSLRVISYAAGLPLALKVLGCLLYDKKEWMSYLARLKDIPEVEIIEKLKLSYDGLKAIEKELFLDIACFFNRQTSIDYAMEVFEACGYHPKIGIEVLRQKALITIEHSSVLGDVFNMHDLVIEMAHHIVRGEHPNNLEKHSRVWNDREIDEMCFGDATMVNCKIEAIVYSCFSYDESSRFCTNVSNMKKLRWLNVYMNTEGEDADEDVDGGPTFLSNELHYIDWNGYIARPFPDGFRPMKLVVLKLWGSRQIELWKGCKRLPLLKVLRLIHMYKLLSTPDFDGLPSLQKLTLIHCDELREIHPSLENHKSLEYVTVLYCPKLLEVPRVPSSLAILKTDCCKSLTTIDKNCKWLR